MTDKISPGKKLVEPLAMKQIAANSSLCQMGQKASNLSNLVNSVDLNNPRTTSGYQRIQPSNNQINAPISHGVAATEGILPMV